MAKGDVVRVAVLSAVRTPIGRFGGALRALPATTLGTLVVRAAIDKAGVRPEEVEEVLLGQGIQAGAGQNPARQVLRGASIPDSAGAATVNMVCGSGMKALHWATLAIRSGEFPLVVAGGMESMSGAPYLLMPEARRGLGYGSQTLEDAIQHDALRDAYGEHELMGLTGERIAQKFHLTREDLDRFALRSNERAVAAHRNGSFSAEIVQIPAGIAPGSPALDHDEGPRPTTSLEKLSQLRPVFRPDGLLTAGNSSQLSDGAAALVLASEAEVERRGAHPLAWIHSFAESGVHPSEVMEAPIPTIRRHLSRWGWTIDRFDRIEHNEAFSSASIALQRTFGIPEDRLNVHGGAVALGHPIGASGARIVVTLIHELVRCGGNYGLATLCMGGGNGLTTVVDRTGL